MTDNITNYITDDIPSEWRVDVENFNEESEPIPPHLPEKINNTESFQEILENDPELYKISVIMDRNEILTEKSKRIRDDLKEIRIMIEKAEDMRTTISKSAEIIHNQCDSQLSTEQNLDIYVKSINSILHYFDDLDVVTMDLRSPIFNVMSADFSNDVRLIENGLRFFETNNHFKESRSYYLKYQVLQNRICEMINNHINTQFDRICKIIKIKENVDVVYKNEIYVKFKIDSTRVRNLYSLCEKTSIFPMLLTSYKDTRFRLLQPIISLPLQDIAEIYPRASTLISFCFKEFDLSQSYFIYENHPAYSKTFGDLLSDLGKEFYDCCIRKIDECDDIYQLCDICLVLKGESLTEEISHIPIMSDRLKQWFNKLLHYIQRNITTQTEAIALTLPSIENYTEVSSKLMSQLFCCLDKEMFSSAASRLLFGCLNIIDAQSKKLEGQTEIDVFKLSHYMVLSDSIQNFDVEFYITIDEKEQESLGSYIWRFFGYSTEKSDIVKTKRLTDSPEGKSKLENYTSLALKSVVHLSSQILLSPIFDIMSKNITDKNQILQALRNVGKILKGLFKVKVIDVIQKHIKDKKHKLTIYQSILRQVNDVILDLKSTLKNKDPSVINEVDNLILEIQNYNFL